MQTSVSLQEPFSYSVYPIFIILAILIILLFILILGNKKPKLQKSKPVKKVTVDVGKIKIKYLKKLDEVIEKINSKNISTRTAYQNVSKIVRLFVYEVTGIKVQNYSLSELANIDMPEIYELVEEYYTPEFAEKSLGDIKSSIEKTRKVIEKWS